MGGSFNPIHRRHLQIAEHALRELYLDRVVFIPNGNPPHKQHQLVAPAHRYAMTQLAILPYENFTISDIEITRSGVIYTVDTLKLLRTLYPDGEFICLIGEDTLYDLPHWRQPLEVFSLCSFAVCKRDSKGLEAHPSLAELRAKGANINFLSLAPRTISATDIRKRLQAGEPVDTLLTPEVHEYIRIAGLYGCPALPGTDVGSFSNLQNRLSDDRLLHSMAVARTAAHLAAVHALPVDQCELAGLLHDCAKCMDIDSLRQIAISHHLKLTDVELQSNGLLHGPVGAVIAKEVFGIEDPIVLNAIAVHTTGYAGMSDIEMVVFLADKIEPYRNHIPDLDEIRQLAETDLYKATYEMLLHSKAYLTRIHRPLHPDTDTTIQWMRKRIQ